MRISSTGYQILFFSAIYTRLPRLFCFDGLNCFWPILWLPSGTTTIKNMSMFTVRIMDKCVQKTANRCGDPGRGNVDKQSMRVAEITRRMGRASTSFPCRRVRRSTMTAAQVTSGIFTSILSIGCKHNYTIINC